MNPYDKINSSKARSFINEATGETSANTTIEKKRGRPKGSSNEYKKECAIGVYVTKKDKIKLQELAHKHRMSIGQYLIFKAFAGTE